MSSIRKRTLPSGRVRWQLDYRDRTGTRRHRQFATKAAAIAAETTIRTELSDGVHVADAASITVAQAGALWLERGSGEGLEASSLRQRRQHLDLHIVPLIGTVRLSRLTKPMAEGFRDELLTDRSRPLARAILTSLKGIVKEAHRRGLIGHNVVAGTAVPRTRRENFLVRIPSKEELRQLLAMTAQLWPDPGPWRPLIVTAIFTGLRCSELRGLTWAHVNLDERVIRVRQRADFQNQVGPPKSEAGNRDVPLAPMALNTLREWKLACAKTELNLVFPSANGRIHSTSNIHKQCWRSLQQALGFRSTYTFHSLRHAAASLFIEQGWSPKKVQTVMGHSSVQVTFDVYGHLWKSSDDDAKAMALLEARLLSG
jgi:integrase